MNSWQLMRQIKFLLEQQNWTGSSTPVFHDDSIIISSNPELEILKEGYIKPVAVITPQASQSDPDHGEEPDLIQQNFDVTLATAVYGDRTGKGALVGANRQGQTDSRGRGLLELEEEMYNAIEKLNTVDGVVIQSVGSGASITQPDAANNVVVFRDWNFIALVTADRFYHPARAFTATPSTGEVALSWSLPPARYDRFRVVLRRATGATAPSSPTDGTGVTLSGNLATSVTDSGLSSDTYSYGLWAQYDETNATAAQADRNSDAVTQTSVVVP